MHIFQLRRIFTVLDGQYITIDNVLNDENSDWMYILQVDLLDTGVFITQPLKFCSEALKQLSRVFEIL